MHRGLEVLLRDGSEQWRQSGTLTAARTLEDRAVAAALAEFDQESAGGLELDLGEQEGHQRTQTTLASQLVDSALAWDLPTDTPELVALRDDVASAGKKFDEYLRKEQRALVEAMVRAYSRRRLRPLLEQFEVLEVEREGRWLLSEQKGSSPSHDSQLWFLSRPDALLLERESRELYLLSYKTAASWDVRKERDARVDMQGLTEGLEVEARYAEYWNEVHVGHVTEVEAVALMGATVYAYIKSLPAAPRIHAIRYEYLLKGERWRDKELSERFGFEARSQKSPLVRGYLNKGMTAADAQWCAQYDYVKQDGSSSNLYYKNWRSTPVYEHMSVSDWIDRLEDSRQVQTDAGTVAWESAAQATGLVREHPLDAAFVTPITIYRSDEDLRDLVEQLEALEVGIARDADRVRQATDAGEQRHLLNVLFPQTRPACVYPSQCRCYKLCHGTDEERSRPLENGFRPRVANHPAEAEGRQVEEAKQ